MDNHGIHAASLKRETAQDRLVSAMKAMLRKLPYSSIQVSMIASDAGLSRKSFYCYFASKDELLRYALEKGKLLYHYAPDERYLSSREAAVECGDVVEAMFHLPAGGAEAFLARTSETERIPCVPFYSVMERRSRLLPARRDGPQRHAAVSL